MIASHKILLLFLLLLVPLLLLAFSWIALFNFSFSFSAAIADRTDYVSTLLSVSLLWFRYHLIPFHVALFSVRMARMGLLLRCPNVALTAPSQNKCTVTHAMCGRLTFQPSILFDLAEILCKTLIKFFVSHIRTTPFAGTRRGQRERPAIEKWLMKSRQNCAVIRKNSDRVGINALHRHRRNGCVIESIERMCDDVRTLPNVVHREIDRRWLERCAIDQLTETGMEDSLTSARLQQVQQVDECNAKSELKFHCGCSLWSDRSLVAVKSLSIKFVQFNRFRLNEWHSSCFGKMRMFWLVQLSGRPACRLPIVGWQNWYGCQWMVPHMALTICANVNPTKWSSSSFAILRADRKIKKSSSWVCEYI